MSYIDAFVAAVPEHAKEAYLEHAATTGDVFTDHGAIEIVETWGDDAPAGEVTSFPMAVQAKPGEAIVFSWIRWPSKEARDLGMPKVMEDPRMSEGNAPMPFDGQRMIFGGFSVVLEL